MPISESVEIANLQALSRLVAETDGQFFVVCKDDVAFDHTSQNKNPVISFIGRGGFSVDISLDRFNNCRIKKFLELEIFSKKPKVLCWNIKPVFSYFKSQCPSNTELFGATEFFDLYLYSRFFDIEQPKNLNFSELAKIFKTYPINKSAYESIHKLVHNPLSTKVIPEIESSFLIDVQNEKRVYPCYEIEGQDNGRLNATTKHIKAYNPHHLTMAQKANLKLKGKRDIFIEFDFKSMEVCVLAAISGDDSLSNDIEQNKDFYGFLAEKLTLKNRVEAKNVMLGILYGMGTKTLSGQLGISENEAVNIRSKLASMYRVSFDYLQKKIAETKLNGFCVDYLGRVRHFLAGEEYKAMNFAVQATAATVCCALLARLYECTKELGTILYSVHDSYCLATSKEEGPDLYKNTIKCLELPSELIPRLKLSVGCKAGKELNNLKPMGKK
jgi:hypothetical protein